MLFVPPDPWSDNIGIGSGFSVFSFRGNVFIPSSVVLVPMFDYFFDIPCPYG